MTEGYGSIKFSKETILFQFLLFPKIIFIFNKLSLIEKFNNIIIEQPIK